MERQLNFIETLMAAPSQKTTASHSDIIKIYIDGASRGNPGLAGAGIYIELNDKEFLSKSVFLETKTNNQAEYLALALGIYFLKNELNKKNIHPKRIEIISDSELLIKQMLGDYKVKDKTLIKIKAFASFLIDNLKCSFRHVLRVSNKKADKLANIAIDKKSKMPVTFAAMLQEQDIQV